nr:MAG TPA: hypothetical protein [Caudoviricetes sp.]
MQILISKIIERILNFEKSISYCWGFRFWQDNRSKCSRRKVWL